MELAAIGSEDFVLGFRLVGLRKVLVADEDNIKNELETVMKDEDVGIIIIHDTALEKLPQELRWRATESTNPVVVAVGEDADDSLREKVKRAIGIDLYKGG